MDRNFCFNIGYLTKAASMEKAAEILSKTGFTYLDYSPEVENENWRTIVKENLKVFESYGLKVNQTHAPFNRYEKYGDIHSELVDRALEATAELNAKYMVVHGDEFDFKNLEFTPERALEYNHKYFLKTVENGKKCNINIAFENVFQENNPKVRFCSKAEDLKELILSFNSDNVSCCWDFGHASVSFKQQQPEKIQVLGSLISCTHVHDNEGYDDTHLPPFYGRIDWKKCIGALKNTGYSGMLSLEMVYGAIPVEIMPDYVQTLYKTCDYLSKLL